MVPSFGIMISSPSGFIAVGKNKGDPTSATQQLPLLSFRIRVLNTQILAYMLDSLVRVSRRVDENHFVSIPNMCHRLTFQCTSHSPRHKLCCLPVVSNDQQGARTKSTPFCGGFDPSLSSVPGMKSTLRIEYNRCIVTRKLRALPLAQSSFTICRN